MSSIAPLTPKGLLEALKRAGYKLIDQDRDNWLLAKGDKDVPVIVPKNGDLVALPIMNEIFPLAPNEILRELATERALRDAAAPEPETET